MSFNVLISLRHWAWLAMLAWAGACISVRAADSNTDGRTIQFSDPKDETLPARVNQLGELGAKRSNRSGLGENIFKPNSFTDSVEGNLGNLPPPSPSRSIINRDNHLKELLDRRRNWAFSTPEDLMENIVGLESLKTPEYGPDGRDLNSLSLVERFYLRMSGENARTNETATSDSWGLPGQTNEWTGTMTPGNADASVAVPGGVQSLVKNFLRSDSDWGADQPSAVPEFLKNSDGLSLEDLRSQEAMDAHIEEFKKILDSHFPLTVPAPREPVQITGVSNWRGAFSAPGFAFTNNFTPGFDISGPRNAFSAVPGTVDPALTLPTAPTAPIAPTPPSLSPAPYAAPGKATLPSFDISAPQRKL